MPKSQSLLLVADVLDQCRSPFWQFAADMPTEEEVATIAAWLREAGYGVSVANRVLDFVDHQIQDTDIVFPLWRAGESRNRTGVVPAVCEARGIPFVGADAFGQVVCQDKELSKAYIRAAGFKTPTDVVWRRPDDIHMPISTAPLGACFVVKPLYLACSIGVDERSLCRSDFEVAEKARELFASGLGPVICEEFIRGDELALCIVEKHGRIEERCASVYRNTYGVCPFRNSLLTFDAKTSDSEDWRIDCIPNESIPEDIWKCANRLVSMLGKLDLCRIDGRLNDNEFCVIEVTPDIHLGLDSLFLGGFAAAGLAPPIILQRIVEAAFQNQQTLHR